MQAILNFFSGANWVMVFGVLFAISEALAMIPAIKSNGVFQMLLSLFAKLAGKTLPPA